MEKNIDFEIPCDDELCEVRLRENCPILFHVTTKAAAETILSSGFRDGQNPHGTGHPFTGVWLSNRPMIFGRIRPRDAATLVVSFDVPLADLEWYEVVEEYETEEERKPYREWVIPAKFIHEHATIAMAEE